MHILQELAHARRDRKLLMGRPIIASALSHTAVLAVRHYTIQGDDADPRYDEFRDVIDYATAEPVPAIRRRHWGDLRRASQEWHEIRRQRLEVNIAGRSSEIIGARWGGPLPTFHTTQFVAHLLDTPEALEAEGHMMSHCIGNSLAYAYACINGDTRIYHLEPLLDGNDTEPSLQPTTLDLRRNRSGKWSIGQHRAARNRRPVEQQDEWAEVLAKACQRAGVSPENVEI